MDTGRGNGRQISGFYAIMWSMAMNRAHYQSGWFRDGFSRMDRLCWLKR